VSTSGAGLLRSVLGCAAGFSGTGFQLVQAGSQDCWRGVGIEDIGELVGVGGQVVVFSFLSTLLIDVIALGGGAHRANALVRRRLVARRLQQDGVPPAACVAVEHGLEEQTRSVKVSR
jgi:hypothetical protein